MKILGLLTSSINKIFKSERPVSCSVEALKPSVLERSPKLSLFSLHGTMGKNTLSLEQSRWSKTAFSIMEGDKRVGYSTLSVMKNQFAKSGTLPKEWFESGCVKNENGEQLLKPYLFVDELAMSDRLGTSNIKRRNKKYGAMSIQKILKMAKENGCGCRILLKAGIMGRTAPHPGKFYNKMGFDMLPCYTQKFRNTELIYQTQFNKLKQKGFDNDSISKRLANIVKDIPNKENGRYYNTDNYEYMYLSNPECTINYPI